MADLKYIERPRSGKIHYSDPTSVREWVVWRTRDVDEALAFLATFSIPLAVDTVAGIPRYFRDMDYTETGNGVWTFKANYAKNPNTISMEVNFTGGTKKVFESLALVRSYSCDTTTSSTTEAAVIAADAAAAAALTATAALATSVPAAQTAEAAAVTAANVAGVDATVFTQTLTAAAKTSQAANAGLQVAGASANIQQAEVNAAFAAQTGDYTLAQTIATSAADFAATASTAATAADTAATDAQAAAVLAVAAAIIAGDSDSIAAGAAATAASSAARTVATDSAIISGLLDTLSTAIQAIATAAAADAAAGIPNLGRMVNVNEKGVDGVEIEDSKCDIVITKHFVASTLAADYISVLYAMSPSKNNAPYSINFKGQILFFDTGELKFKNFTFKQTGDDDLDITFYLSASKGLGTSDAVTIGNSPSIEKEGWDYLSVFFMDNVEETGFTRTKKPKAAYIHKVYKPRNFDLLQL